MFERYLDDWGVDFYDPGACFTVECLLDDSWGVGWVVLEGAVDVVDVVGFAVEEERPVAAFAAAQQVDSWFW